MAVPICAASPDGLSGTCSLSLTDAGQAIQRDDADGLSLNCFVAMCLFLGSDHSKLIGMRFFVLRH